ncbi:MAG: Hpt domain-containing protein [Luteolibacter sp.]
MIANQLQAVNANEFAKMAYGDLDGFRELAAEFFVDMFSRLSGWKSLLEEGEFARLREELHRTKGGASIFGLERVVALIRTMEEPERLELLGFDIDGFEAELREAEKAVAGIEG